jgi:hypothetical protein
MPARILYAGQTASITPAGAAGASGVRYLPVQSAACDVSRPLENVLSFGHLGTLARVQNSVSTCKSDIKTYLANSTGITGASNYANLLNAEFIQVLTGQALAGQVSTISVTPGGFTMSGILSNLGIDISNGSFATADLSFVGVGEPYFAPAPTTSSFSEQPNMPTSFSPVTSTNVSGTITGGCANSFKFSLDIPNEVISCLGGNISGTQTAIANSFLQVAKPPFSATISVEGLAVDAPTGAQLNSAYIVGKLAITLPNGTLESRSVNQSVGSAGASYNYTLSDASANFADVQ